MRHPHPRSTLVVAAGLALMVAACTIRGSDPADTTALSAPIVEQTTTTAAPATTTTAPTTTVAPTTTMSAWDALPPHVKAADWVMATYESIGYSCEGAGSPDVECDAPHRVEYTRPLIGSEHGVDFFDFLGSYDLEAEPFPANSPYSDWSLTGSVADYPLAGFGHGIRMQQLDRAPPGLDTPIHDDGSSNAGVDATGRVVVVLVDDVVTATLVVVGASVVEVVDT